MRAATVDEPGATARYGDFADPEPVEGESALTVLAAGIHPIVRSLAAGTHYGSGAAYPIIPGVDCVARDARGTVRYAGDIRAPWGTLAEQVAARMGVPVPEGTDPVQVAAAMNPGLSSWLPLVDRQRTRGRLGTVVIIGATGVAGRVAVQNALALGADRVVGLGRDAGRLAEVAALGGRPIALGDGAGALRRALEGDPPSLILDYLWGALPSWPGSRSAGAVSTRTRRTSSTCSWEPQRARTPPCRGLCCAAVGSPSGAPARDQPRCGRSWSNCPYTWAGSPPARSSRPSGCSRCHACTRRGPTPGRSGRLSSPTERRVLVSWRRRSFAGRSGRRG